MGPKVLTEAPGRRCASLWGSAATRPRYRGSNLDQRRVWGLGGGWIFAMGPAKVKIDLAITGTARFCEAWVCEVKREAGSPSTMQIFLMRRSIARFEPGRSTLTVCQLSPC
jgi:hypothetical protein